MKRVNVVLFRGLIGNVYSRGIDVVGAKIAKLPGVDYVTVEDYTNWRSVRDRILKWKDPTILGPSHSYGANAATIVAEALRGKVKIPLVLSVDPSQWFSVWLMQFGPSRIGENVALAINYYQHGFPIGNVKLSGSNVRNIPVNTTHIQIDDLPLVHDAAIAEVKKVIGV